MPFRVPVLLDCILGLLTLAPVSGQGGPSRLLKRRCPCSRCSYVFRYGGSSALIDRLDGESSAPGRIATTSPLQRWTGIHDRGLDPCTETPPYRHINRLPSP